MLSTKVVLFPLSTLLGQACKTFVKDHQYLMYRIELKIEYFSSAYLQLHYYLPV